MFRRVARPHIFLARSALTALEREAERTAPLETGGVLAGYIRPDTGAVVVTTAVGPGPNAHHAKSRFDPDGPWHEQQIADIYSRSGRLYTYLGDWHSHPCGRPMPSPLDHKTARHIAASPAARAPHPLMIIISQPDGSWSPTAYRYARRRLRATTLTAFNDVAAAALA